VLGFVTWDRELLQIDCDGQVLKFPSYFTEQVGYDGIVKVLKFP